MEPRKIEFNGSPNWGSRATATITFSADLLTKVFLVVDLPTLDGTSQLCDDWGHAMIAEVSLEIGSVVHNVFSGDYLHFLESQTVPVDKRCTEMHGRFCDRAVADNGSEGAEGKALLATTGDQDGKVLFPVAYSQSKSRRAYIPLPFWFCRDYCNALPLVAMHLSEAKVKVTFRSQSDVIFQGTAATFAISDVHLLGEYVFLNDTSRHRFANSEHPYLITQVQEDVSSVASSVSPNTTIKNRLSMNHMVKELCWTHVASTDVGKRFITAGDETGAIAGTGTGDSMSASTLLLNNNKRWDSLDALYHRVVQPHCMHTVVGNPGGVVDEFLYSFSFALDPEGHAPSGTINFSRIENIELEIKYATARSASTLYIWAVSYNAVRVKNGVASLHFSS